MEEKTVKSLKYDKRRKEISMVVNSQAPITNKDGVEIGTNIVKQEQIWKEEYIEHMRKSLNNYKRTLEANVKQFKANLTLFEKEDFTGIEEFVKKQELVDKFNKRKDNLAQLKDVEEKLKTLNKDINELNDTLK